MGVMILRVNQGSEVVIQAEGNDAEDAVSALVDLVKSNFGE